MKSLAFILALTFALSAPAAEKIRVLIFTGGHGYPKEPFLRMFAENPEITFTAIEHTKGTADGWERADLTAFDVIVLYDMPPTFTPAQQARFKSIFPRGTGLVVLHHALVADGRWPDYERIIGGIYPTRTGPNEPPVGYEHDVEIPVVVANHDHPITAGFHDFTTKDEVYWGFRVGKDTTPLLTTTQAKSGNPISWCRTEGKSRVVYLQLGHGLPCMDYPPYRDYLARCLRWAARR